jgi:effector-binding domain-containing protein
MTTTTLQPRLERRAAVPYLGITAEVTGGVPAVVDRIFPQLFAWLGERGITPAGAPILRVREVDPGGEPLVLDAGVPVAPATTGGGDVVADVLPAGRYAVLRHTGPYRSEHAFDLGAARDVLLAWMWEQNLLYSRASERGFTVPCAYDRLLAGPPAEPDPSRWQTELAYLTFRA